MVDRKSAPMPAERHGVYAIFHRHVSAPAGNGLILKDGLVVNQQRPEIHAEIAVGHEGYIQRMSARRRQGRDHILSINAHSLDEADGWIEGMRRYWEARLDAMERLLGELEDGVAMPGPEDRKHGSR